MAAEITQEAAGRAERPATVKVWDILVRIMHWGLVTVYAVAFLSSEEAEHEGHGWYDNAHESSALHEYAGLTVLGIVALRILWGVIGTRHARFTDFVYRPSTVVRYLGDMAQFKAPRYLGHNPAGGAMVIVLLVVLLITAGTGYMSVTEPYAAWHWLEDVHGAFANLSLGLIVLHVLGVVFASIEHRESLVKAMITGRKRDDFPPS